MPRKDDVSSLSDSSAAENSLPSKKRKRRKPRPKTTALTAEQQEELEEDLRDAVVHCASQRPDANRKWTLLEPNEDDPDCAMTCKEFIAMMTAIIQRRRGNWQIP